MISEDMWVAHQAHDPIREKCPLCLKFGVATEGQEPPLGRVMGVNPPQTVEISEW